MLPVIWGGKQELTKKVTARKHILKKVVSSYPTQNGPTFFEYSCQSET